MLRPLAAAVATAAIVCLAVWAGAPCTSALAAAAEDEAQRCLAEEVHAKGWIVFSARSRRGDWDLFLCRPDGSQLRNLTRTPDYHEAAPQFSRDGRRLLYRCLRREEKIDGNHYGAQGELVLANSDGSGAEVFGKSGEYPWASWSPDGQQIACLSIQGISFIDLASRQVVRTLGRKGFFQQLTWSPDGKWLSGVSNSFGTGWSVARMEADSGATSAVSRVDCCTPDWFPDSRSLIFSNRPPGQKANKGYGWTQLWMADAEGKTSRLVYGEDGRHVYGGHVSPDGRYVLLTGNVQEDGDPGNAGAPMGLLRLADAPVVVGPSPELRRLHPEANSGPVLTLPAGWEPCWTAAEIAADARVPTASSGKRATATEPAAPKTSPAAAAPDDVTELAAEVRQRGWIVFSAATAEGDWDLFVMRPDGSDRRSISNTRAYNEAGARFSPDGKRLLYYRMPKTEALDNNTYGTYELVVAQADGSRPVVYGKGFPWASWGPDGRQVACLAKSGIQIVDLESRKVVRELPRKGIVQQLCWSADGKWFAGTANGLGPYWNIGRLSAETGQLNAVSQTERYNCTPDWLPDSQRIIYSRGIIPEAGGWAELWAASGDGKQQRLVYAEHERHLYGGCVSPDGKYVLFTRSELDLGKVDNSRTRMAIVRWADTPMVGRQSQALRQRYPEARHGPVLDLSWGWEPHWTFADTPQSPLPPGEGQGEGSVR
jgi:Tol biopolymer transport system component